MWSPNVQKHAKLPTPHRVDFRGHGSPGRGSASSLSRSRSVKLRNRTVKAGRGRLPVGCQFPLRCPFETPQRKTFESQSQPSQWSPKSCTELRGWPHPLSPSLTQLLIVAHLETKIPIDSVKKTYPAALSSFLAQGTLLCGPWSWFSW